MNTKQGKVHASALLQIVNIWVVGCVHSGERVYTTQFDFNNEERL